MIIVINDQQILRTLLKIGGGVGYDAWFANCQVSILSRYSQRKPLATHAGDPEIRDFGGNNFEFEGRPGSFYEAVADEDHQVSISLKVGVMWDHNGTYMEGLGVKAHDQEILVTLGDDGCLQG